MEFRILGPMEVLDGPRRVRLPAGHGRALLALLVLNVGTAVRAERLIDELWGEQPPPTAPTALQGLVSKLRKALGPETVETAGGAYLLSCDRDAVDVEVFKGLVERARGAAPEERAASLRDALALWRGPALADFTYEPFAQGAIAALEESRLAALEDRIDADLALGRTGLVAEINALIEQYPLRERLRALQMLALYREGRQAEALEAYLAARATLAEEMGVDLGPALRELHEKILRQDASLIAPAAMPASDTWLPGERHIALSLALAEVHLVLGRFTDAQAMLRNIFEADDGMAGQAARLEHARIQFILGPDPEPLSAISEAAQAATEFFADDPAGLARATFLTGCVRMRAGEMARAEDAFRQSMAHADRAGHMRERLAARWMVGEVVANGAMPARDAADVCGELGHDLGTTPPGLLLQRAVLVAMTGEFDEAAELIAGARKIVSEMRAPRLMVFVHAAEASVASLKGDVEAAARATRARLDIAQRGEERENIAQAAGWLALLLRRLGQNDEAGAFAASSVERAPFGVPGKAISLAASGDARAAVDLVPEEMPNLRGDVLLELARELRSAGSEADALQAEREAARLYRLKGNVTSAERLVPAVVAPT